MSSGNADEIRLWCTAGEHRVAHPEQDDGEVLRHNALFRAAAAIRDGEDVLDVGCGTGQSTRDASVAAGRGSVLGVDVSVPMLQRARSLAEHLPTVDFMLADAQVHPFPDAGYDVVISRFGSMFFADPAAAFGNLRRALRPTGRLVLLVWQARERNEWSTVLHTAISGTAPRAAEPGPNPFSLADPQVLRQVLTGAGFTDVELTDVHEPVYYGRDVASALSMVRGFHTVATALADLEPAAAGLAIGRLRAVLAQHLTGDGVLLDSRAWIVTARCAVPGTQHGGA